MGPSCGGGGDGEVATKRAKLSSDASAGAGSEDRLSALPDDILVLILHQLGTRAAARTSVLSRRWRRVWALLPELHFVFSLEPHQIGPAIQAHEAAIRCLCVWTRDAGAESVAAWLPVAARRLYGTLFFQNLEREGNAQESDDEEEGPGQSGAFELPCLEHATNVSLRLGFLGLAVPPAGVFARLTGLYLSSVRFHGPVLLGDAVSWPRCPCLQKLTVLDTCGLDNLAIHSDSLLEVELTHLRSLRQLSIVAPVLKELKVERCCFYNWSQPVASITTPQLTILTWMDRYDPSSVHLSKIEHLQFLMPLFFFVYEPESFTHNQSCLSLLRRFKVVEGLTINLAYVRAQNTCPPGCICGEHQNWRTEHLLLNRLKEVEITRMRGSEHEVTFVKQLFNWSTSLEKMRVVFDKSVTENVAKELSQVLRSFGRPGIHMGVRTYMEDMLKSALLSGGRDNLV